MKYHYKSSFNISIITAAAIILLSAALYADGSGRTGRTLKSGTTGCNCHGGQITGVSVVISGPDSLAINMQSTYTVTITGGPLTAGGVDIASSTGALANISSDLQLLSGELTHTSPKLASGGAVSFQFKYTAPATLGTQTLYATGNSVNNNGGPDGDQWNFASNKTITVVTSLPVELTSFTAAKLNKGIRLDWSTATETNNYGFRIERKEYKSDWSFINFVPGAGNSASPKQYSFIDKDISLNTNYTYRLAQVDVNGTITYSHEVEIRAGAIPEAYSLEQNYPNPFNPSTVIKYSLPVNSNVSLKIYNSIGKEVTELVNGFQEAGTHQVTFDASNLSSGIYYYSLKSGNFTQTRKMIVIK